MMQLCPVLLPSLFGGLTAHSRRGGSHTVVASSRAVEGWGKSIFGAPCKVFLCSTTELADALEAFGTFSVRELKLLEKVSSALPAICEDSGPMSGVGFRACVISLS